MLRQRRAPDALPHDEQETDESKGDVRASGPFSTFRRIFVSVFPAVPMIVVWPLVIANHLMHTLMRPTMWPWPVVVIGHALVAVVVVAFAQVTSFHPGKVPPIWSGTAEVPTWPVIVPQRAHYLMRSHEVVLGFDHFCEWLNMPIGWRNRKFFLLFLLWACALAAFGTALSTIELYRHLESRPPPPEVSHPEHLVAAHQAAHAAHPVVGITFTLIHLPTHLSVYYNRFPVGIKPWARKSVLNCSCDRALAWTDFYLHSYMPLQQRGGLPWLVLALSDAVATVALACFGGWHALLVLSNRTSVGATDESRYNMGALENVRQVMGRRWWLWPLPVWAGDAPHGNGQAWPERSGPVGIARE
jgi:hypothetical protein